MGDEAIYLYCVTRGEVDLKGDLAGIDGGGSVIAHAHAGLVAWVTRVPLADFVGDEAEVQLQDVAWLGPRALRHGAVIEAVMEEAAVFPLPFGTLFSSFAALDGALDGRRDEILAALERVADHCEWGVECQVDDKRAIDALISERCDRGEITLPEAAGRRHLELQRLRRALVSDLDAWSQPITIAIAQELDTLADGRVERRSAQGEERGARWAFLVATSRTDDFHARVAELAGRYAGHGLNLRLTGPWAPYSFCGDAR